MILLGSWVIIFNNCVVVGIDFVDFVVIIESFGFDWC